MIPVSTDAMMVQKIQLVEGALFFRQQGPGSLFLLNDEAG
jgi:hypothetical protein